MYLRANENAHVGRIRDVLASWVGSGIHRMAGTVRWLFAATGEGDPEKIAVLCDSFLRYGSAQAVGLRQTGLTVTLYYVDRVNEFGGNEEDRALYLDRAQAAGVELVVIPRRRIRSLLKDTFWLHRDLRRRKIATAVVQWHIDPRYVTVGFALPVALIVHDPQPHSGDAGITFSLPVRLVSRMAELTSFCLIIHSARLIEQIRRPLRRLPIGVVPHGADIAPAPAPIPRKRRLLIFGRLYAYKGVDTALDAFRALPEEMSDVQLIVAGRGPLAALARGQSRVEVHEGYVTDTDVDDLLDSASLVLLPYKDATQSGVGSQAVGRGVPCVVSSAGGLPELVQASSASLVVAPDSPTRLAEAIVEHIDHDESLRTAIYDHAATHFAWPVAAQILCSELRRFGLTVESSQSS
jgi:glycosyltransferase involved in cell wall biosynthesis